jgi:high-affinity iron transporter
MTELSTSSPRRLGRGRELGAVALVLLLGLLAFAAAPGSGPHTRPHVFGVPRLAGRTDAPNPLGVRATTVFGSNVPAKLYGEEIGKLEDQGVNLQGQMASDLSPLPASAFDAPEHEYERYAQRWTNAAQHDVATLAGSLRGGGGARELAQRQWVSAWTDYLRLGAVYGLFQTLDQAIDTTPGVLPRGTADPSFTGFHRLELGLWTGQSLASLLPIARRLLTSLGALHHAIAHLAITPLEYATRAHEILEDAQRDFLSGADVPWSGEGVAALAAGTAATHEVLATLAPLMSGRENAQGVTENELILLDRALAAVRAAHGGVYPSLSQLTMAQRELLNGTLAGVLSALAQVPGVLETTSVTGFPAIPGTKG